MVTRTIQTWLRWYPQDWRADPRLRQCSLAARGLWIELLGYMHESEPYGHLMLGNGFVTDKQIALLVGAPLAIVKKCMEELEKNSVFSLTSDGKIYSRRMVRDHQKANQNKENGLKGGNPALNPGPKAKSLEARVQSPESREKEIEADASPPPKTKRSKNKPLVQIPDDFTLTTGRVKIAVDAGLDAEVTFGEFRRWAVSSGRALADWDVRWTIWVEDQLKRIAKTATVDGHRISHYGDDGLPRYVGDNDG